MSKSFREALITEELICPKCKDPLSPPIYHCDKGHSFCNTCYETGSECRLCGSKCSGGRTHHLDRIVQLFIYPCKFSDKGCRKKCQIQKLKAHQEECQTFEMNCPFFFGLGCSYTGNRQQTVFHCQLVHSTRAVVGEGLLTFRVTELFNDLMKIQQEINHLNKKQTVFVDFYMLYVNENIFQIVYQTDLINLKVAMYRLSGPSEVDEKYEFTIIFHNGDETPLAMVSSECVTTVGKVYSPLSDEVYVNINLQILKLCQNCSVQIVTKK